VVSGVLYVIAGFDSAARSTAGVFVYDRVRWAAGPLLPTGLDHPAAATADGALYVAGGFSSGRTSARVFRLGHDRWEEMPPLRHPRGALGLVAVGSKLYALGGNDGGSQVAVPEVFDTKARVWQDLSAMPAPRNHVASFAYRGLTCVAGGRSPNLARVDCYDPASGAWQVMPSLPTATSGAGAAALADQVVVAGGESTDQNTIVDQVARFQAGGWRTEAMLHPRHGIQLAVLDGRAWACGGAPKPGLGPVNVCTSIA
jgi:Kelch motif